MMDDLKTRIRKHMERIDALTLRERGIVFVGIMAVLYTVAANMLFPPLFSEQTRLQQQLKSKRDQLRTFDAQIQAALAKETQDPNAPLRAKLAELEKRNKELDQAMAIVMARLVSPKDMVRLVEDILRKNRKLELVRIESLPAEALGSDTGQAKSAREGLMAYRHGMRIEIKGQYLDILAYLHSLENMPWKVYWGQVSLQVEKYPVSKVTLQIYTLSTHESWIAI